MVERHFVDSPHRDAAEIPEENVEREENRLSVFEWYCTDCKDWLGWPENPDHDALACVDPAACPHTDGETGACGHVVCGECEALAGSHEWVLEDEQARKVAQRIFDGGDEDVELAFRKALLEDLQHVTDGESVEKIVEKRHDLFNEYIEAIENDRRD